jgi:hypothetical protein
MMSVGDDKPKINLQRPVCVSVGPMVLHHLLPVPLIIALLSRIYAGSASVWQRAVTKFTELSGPPPKPVCSNVWEFIEHIGDAKQHIGERLPQSSS